MKPVRENRRRRAATGCSSVRTMRIIATSPIALIHFLNAGPGKSDQIMLKETKEKIDQNRQVCVEEGECPASSTNEDTYGCDQQYAEESRVNGAAFKLDISSASRRDVQPD